MEKFTNEFGMKWSIAQEDLKKIICKHLNDIKDKHILYSIQVNICFACDFAIPFDQLPTFSNASDIKWSCETMCEITFSVSVGIDVWKMFLRISYLWIESVLIAIRRNLESITGSLSHNSFNNYNGNHSMVLITESYCMRPIIGGDDEYDGRRRHIIKGYHEAEPPPFLE